MDPLLTSLRNHLRAVLLAAVAVIFFGFLILLFTTEWGKKILDELLASLAYTDLGVRLSEKLASNVEKRLPVRFTSNMLNFSKLLFTTLVKAGIFRILSLLFLPVKTTSTEPSGIIDESEAILKSPWYRIKEFAISKLSGAGSAVILLIMTPLEAILLRAEGAIISQLVSLLLFVAIFLLFSFFYACIDRKSFRFTIKKTIIFNMLPALLEVFVTNVLVVATYMLWTSGSDKFIWFLLLLLVWLTISKPLTDWLKKKLAYLSLNQSAAPKIPLLPRIFWLLSSCNTIILLYGMSFMNGDESNIFTRSLYNLPFLHGFSFEPDSQAFWLRLLTLYAIALLIATIHTYSKKYYVALWWKYLLWGLEQGLIFLAIAAIGIIYVLLRDNFTWFAPVFLLLMAALLLILLLKNGWLLFSGLLQVLCIVAVTIFRPLLAGSLESYIVFISVTAITGFLIYCIRDFVCPDTSL